MPGAAISSTSKRRAAWCRSAVVCIITQRPVRTQPTLGFEPVQSISPVSVPLSIWFLLGCSRVPVVSERRRRSPKACERLQKRTWSAPGQVRGPQLLQPWLEVSLVAWLDKVTRRKGTEKETGEVLSLFRRHDVSNRGGRLPARLLQNEEPRAKSERGNFSFAAASGTLRLSSDGLTEVQRRRLLPDANRACHALNWMHGEGHRPSPLVVSEDKIQCLRADVQHRVIRAALQWIDADSAADEHEALARLLKGRTGHVSGVSFTVGSNEYSRVSLPDSVVDAPPLIEMLPAEAKVFL